MTNMDWCDRLCQTGGGAIVIDWNDYPVGNSRTMYSVCGKKPIDTTPCITIKQKETGVG
jgi:hypothetical protein